MVEACLIVDHCDGDDFFGTWLFGGWFNWWLDRTPLQWIGTTFGGTKNVYYYQATQALGEVRLSFISHTVLRYYADLHLRVAKKTE